jgi:hypothetical protein
MRATFTDVDVQTLPDLTGEADGWEALERIAAEM